jgi:predicted nuclease of predicted toxin-antitoxin system
MILADENLNFNFINHLRAAGYEVLSVYEQFRGITDPSVVQLALKEKAILITEDKDFGELVFAHKIARLTVVFLRYRKSEVEVVRRLLLHVVQEYTSKEGNFFVTIARGKVRVTEL